MKAAWFGVGWKRKKTFCELWKVRRAKAGAVKLNCTVSVEMGDSSDGGRWPSEMEFSQTKFARKQSWSEASSVGEYRPRSTSKKIWFDCANGTSSTECRSIRL